MGARRSIKPTPLRLHCHLSKSKAMAFNSNSATSSAFSCALGILLLVGFASSNIDQDRTECADQVIGLATCLPYVGGEAKAPTPDCCSGLKLVLQNSKKCMCILIKDRDDPTLGLKVNLTLALGLPNTCHAPANITECIDLLHLPPNSPLAKDFEGLRNIKGANTTSSAVVSGNSDKNGQNPQEKSDGGMRRKRWLGAEIFVWFFFTSSLLLTRI